MKKRKYALFPGTVISQSDGDRHYIGAATLARLYGVDINECILVDYSRPETFQGRDLSGYIRLYPRADGNYVINQAI